MKTLRISKNSTAILRTLVLSIFLFGLIVSVATTAATGIPQDEPGHRIALKITEPQNSSLTSEQLSRIREIGVDLLEISFPTSIPTSDLEQFYILLDTEIDFTIENEVESNQEEILNSIQLSYNSVPDQLKDNVAAIKVFDYPADYRSTFSSSSDSLFHQLSESIEKPFYYQSAFSAPEHPVQQVDFQVNRITAQLDSTVSGFSPIIFFEPSESKTASLSELETFLNRSLNEEESLIILPADWFLSRVESQPSFSTIISSYLEGERVDFPMPAETSESADANWPIILLLLIWASFVLHYKYQPMYKATLPRYFFYHSFFVHDVMQHRIRSALPGVIVLLQHTVITGLFFYMLADGFISELGLKSLSHHYSALFISGFEELSVFIIGVLFSLLLHIISIAWLYLPNKKLKQLTQVVNLYCWPFHINLIIATIAFYVVEVLSAEDWAIATVIVYFFFWFSGFIVASFDSARFLKRFRIPNLILTVGLYFLLMIASLIIALWFPGIYQPLEMAFMLP